MPLAFIYLCMGVEGGGGGGGGEEREGEGMVLKLYSHFNF